MAVRPEDRVMTDMPRRRGFITRPQLDEDGEPTDAAGLPLTPEERHDRRYGIPPRRERIEADPGLVALVASLQVAS